MREIPLGRSGLVALVDDEDYERIAAHRWHAKTGRGAGYALRWDDDYRTRIRMHREILCVGADVVVDHANGNGFDNRRANLRVCTRADNSRNARALPHQRFKGIQRSDGAWRARIRIDGKLTHLGTFKNEIDAALAYDAAAREHFGEFACVNYPREGERAATIAA